MVENTSKPSWEKITEWEESKKYGIIFLYDCYKNYISKLEETDNKELLLEIQKFKIKVGIKLIENSNYVRTNEIFDNINQKMKEKELVLLDKELYNTLLLGLVKCKINLRKPIESEIIIKRLIDKDYIKEKKYLKELSYESNKGYWANKVKWIGFTSIIILIIYGITKYILNFEGQNNLLILGIIFLAYNKIYRVLNQDYLSIDLLEIVVIENVLREFVKSRLKVQLGYQPEILRYKIED